MFQASVDVISKACSYHIWALRCICRIHSVDVTQMLVCSIVSSCFNYCNMSLYGAHSSSIAELQCTQNSLTQIMLQQLRQSHTIPVLHSLHWHSVLQCVEYKFAILTFKTCKFVHHEYLNCLLREWSTHVIVILHSSLLTVLHTNCTRSSGQSCFQQHSSHNFEQTGFYCNFRWQFSFVS